jgi:flavin-dependent dehydrogenase
MEKESLIPRIPNLSQPDQLSTLSLLECPNHWDLIVIGGGLAGLAVATTAARHGKRVLLCEKKSYPRAKVCGACLNGNALAALHELGFSNILDRYQAPLLNKVHIANGKRQLELNLPGGRAITREKLDYELALEAQKLGVTLLQDCHANLDDCQSSTTQREIKLTQGRTTRTLTAKLIAITAGLAGIKLPDGTTPAKVAPHSKIGMGTTCLDPDANIEPGKIYLCVRQEGYLGIVQAEQGVLNLAAAIQPSLLKSPRSFTQWARETLQLYGLQINLPCDSTHWQGTPALTRQLAIPAGPRWLAIGDSAGYVEPFTGEGMAWALASGIVAGNLIASHLDTWNSECEKHWITLHRSLIRSRQSGCRCLAWCLERPTFGSFAMSVVTQFPWIGGYIVSNINQPTQIPSSALY